MSPSPELPAVLFVDDEVNIRRALARLFRNEPIRIQQAGSARQALEILERESIQVVVSDHRMPGMLGVELLSEVRARFPDVIRMMLTGFTEMDVAVEAINKGEIYRLITKPWNDEELRAIVRQALDSYFMRHEIRRLDELTKQQNTRLQELNHTLEIKVQDRTKEVKQKHAELRTAYVSTVRALVAAMGETGAGIFEIANEETGLDPERIRNYLDRLRDLAVDTGVTVTWGMFSSRRAPDYWRQYMDLLDETAEAGGRMFAQVHSRSLNLVLSFEANMLFDRYPVWEKLRSRPLEEQKRRLLDPELRAKLVESAETGRRVHAVGAEPRRPNYDWIFAIDKIEGPHASVSEVAKARGLHPADAMIELALETDLKQLFFQPLANENQDDVLELMRHPHSAVTFSDSGAHVSQIMDSSLQTHVLSHWVREKEALTLSEAVRMLSFDNASAWGFSDRGLLREGFAADLIAFDPDQVAPLLPELVHDLPAGVRRLVQKSRGFEHTIVNGEPILRGTDATGALPGKLLRGPLATA